jgi:hypothetical protein
VRRRRETDIHPIGKVSPSFNTLIIEDAFYVWRDRDFGISAGVCNPDVVDHLPLQRGDVSFVKVVHQVAGVGSLRLDAFPHRQLLPGLTGGTLVALCVIPRRDPVIQLFPCRPEGFCSAVRLDDRWGIHRGHCLLVNPW